MNWFTLTPLLASKLMMPIVVGIVSLLLLLVAAGVAIVWFASQLRGRRPASFLRVRYAAVVIPVALVVALGGIIWYAATRFRAARADREVTEITQSLDTIQKLGGKIGFRDGHAVDVDLGATRTTDSALKHVSLLNKLEALDLHLTNVTDQGMEHLAELKNLRKLSLFHTVVTDVGMEHLAGLDEIRQLDLVDTNITDDALAHLHAMKRLYELNLQGTRITDEGLKHLRSATDLRTLLLPKGITDEGMEQIRHMKQLRELSLINSSVTDASVEKITQLKNLKRIWLNETGVTLEGVKRIRKSLPECYVHLDPQAQWADVKVTAQNR